jgi:hypothetical protein
MARRRSAPSNWTNLIPRQSNFSYRLYYFGKREDEHRRVGRVQTAGLLFQRGSIRDAQSKWRVGAGPVTAAAIAESSTGCALPLPASGRCTQLCPEGIERESLTGRTGSAASGWGRTDGEPEAHKDRLDPLGLGDRRNDRRSSSTFLAPQNTFAENPLHQLSPRKSSLT